VQVRRWTSSLRDDFGYAWLAGFVMAATTVLLAVVYDLPVRDPDAIIPSYIRMPLIILVAILTDIVPRALWRARRAPRTIGSTWLEVTRERWPASHWRFAIGGALAWYLTYAAFRNIKSFVPFVNDHVYDEGMAKLDRILWLGNDPSTVLHDLLGTQWAATLMSLVYIVWIVLVPATIAIALVFTRNTNAGSWYVTAVAFDWALGAAIYLMFPSIGPIYSTPQLFDDLRHTYVTDLQNSMWGDRLDVLAGPWAADGLQTIAAFASLHVGIMVTICLVVRAVGLPRWIQVISWAFLGLTIVATTYLGWHFSIDVIAGAALGAFTFWTAALATGNHVGLRPALRLSDTADPPSSVRSVPLVKQEQDRAR